MSFRRLFSLNPRSTTDQAPPAYVQVPPSLSFSKVDSEMYDETVEADPRRPNLTRLGSSQKTWNTWNSTSDHGATTKYLYYRLYGKDHDLPSKASFDPKDPSLGRIRLESVPPPRTLASLKRCIARVENKPALGFGDLYETGSSTTLMKERTFISPLEEDCPGLAQDCPMALVQTLVRIQAIQTPHWGHDIFNEVYYTIGDIFFTDGVVNGPGMTCYEVTSSVGGSKGRVQAGNFKFLDDL